MSVVLIDSWGFTLRVAQGVRARAIRNIKLIKYVGPQVWATRPGRAKTLAAAVDHLICIHDFEVAVLRTPYGLDLHRLLAIRRLAATSPATVAALQSAPEASNRTTESHVLVLPGSRQCRDPPHWP